MWQTIRKEWDRLIVHLMLISFGVYSIVNPLLSVRRAVPPWTELMFDIEFILAGGLLIFGTLRHRKIWRRLGYSICVIGLSTIALLLFLAGGFRVGAYCILMSAFAMQLIVNARRVGNGALQEHQLREAITQALEEER
jgi:hypothetical protein